MNDVNTSDVKTESLPVSYFETVCEFVVQTYGDLLSPNELDWIDNLNTIEPTAKILYVRLLNRSFNTFRVSKLSYDDVPNLDQAIKALISTPLATSTPPLNAADVNRLFTKSEIVTLFGRDELKNKAKADLVSVIYRDSASNALKSLQDADQWITIEGHDVYSLFLLCFFGNRYQDTSEFVMRELGHTCYYPYPLDKTNRVFESRKQIDAHLEYYECAAKYEHVDKSDVAALLQLDQLLPKPQANDPTLSRRVDRLRIKLARQLERIGAADEAFGLYTRCVRAPARERMARIYYQQAKYDASWQLLETIQQHPYCDEELQFVDTFKPKLAKQLGTRHKAKRYKPISSKLVLKPIGNSRVEQVAQAYYQNQGSCFYVENALFNGVLGLLIWDEIFSAIPGVFFNPFQYAPADFYDPLFCQRRQAQIEARMREIDNDEFANGILARFDQHRGIANPMVHWEALSQPLLKTALHKIPTAHWRACFERLLQDLRNNRTGFPDLIHFPKSGGYELIEIKGPGDAVQKNQSRWFAYFESVGVPYRVVHVKWAGTPVTS